MDVYYNLPPGVRADEIPDCVPEGFDLQAQFEAHLIAYELFEFSLLRNRREYQWRRLRTRYGVYIIHLCNPGNNRECWSKVKGALKRRRFQQQ